MKVAIAGSGDISRYETEELLDMSINVVILSRSEKDWFKSKEGVEVRVTDFHSNSSIYENIKDCNGLVSSIEDATSDFKRVHSNLIDAMLKTDACRRFISSEYIGDSINFPDQPMFYNDTRVPIRNKLKAISRNELEWTLLNGGWLSDYFLPLKRRYIKDIGALHPVDWIKGIATIPGTGDEPISFTSARDIAKAVALLFATDEYWEQVTFVCGESSTWNRAISDNLGNLKIERKSLCKIAEDLVKGSLEGDEEKKAVAMFQLWSVSGACSIPLVIAKKHKQKYFKEVEFRAISDLLNCCGTDTALIP